MKARRIALAAAAALVVLLALGPAAAVAVDPATGVTSTGPLPAAVQLQARQAKDGTWQVKAHVTDAAGEAVAGTDVSFGLDVEFLGSRRVALGTVSTDAAGWAALVYRPTWNGSQVLVAEAGGQDGTPVVAGRLAVDVEGVQAPIAPDPVALPSVRALAVPVAALVVASVWAALLLVFISAVVGIWRARPGRHTVIGGSQHKSIPGRVGAGAVGGKR